MILIDSGFTVRRALLFNFFSACTAFVGFFVGVAISENDEARIWIFSITAGTFIYIALVDLVNLLILAKFFDHCLRFLVADTDASERNIRLGSLRLCDRGIPQRCVRYVWPRRIDRGSGAKDIERLTSLLVVSCLFSSETELVY